MIYKKRTAIIEQKNNQKTEWHTKKKKEAKFGISFSPHYIPKVSTGNSRKMMLVRLT